jgi:CO/xanthine dehydrogenase FAD-binding subunit
MKYEAPKSVEEAVALLDSEPASCVFAGATDIIPQLRAGRPEPKLMVDLKNIPQLMGVSRENGTWTLGAATPVSLISGHAEFQDDLPGLAEASALIGSDQIQNRASLGGNVCNASPGADTVPALIVNHAQAVIASNGSIRTIPVSEIATGPGSTSLKAGEFVVEFKVETPPPRSSDAYQRFIPRTEMDIAVVDAAARITLDESGNCLEAVIAVGAAAPTVVRVPAAEDALHGKAINDETLSEVMAAASAACNPIDDKRGTIAFRRQVAGVLAKRVVLKAADRARKPGGSV